MCIAPPPTPAPTDDNRGFSPGGTVDGIQVDDNGCIAVSQEWCPILNQCVVTATNPCSATPVDADGCAVGHSDGPEVFCESRQDCILDQLWFSVHVEGLEGKAVYPGSTVYLTGREEQVLLALSIERGPGSLGKPLSAEFIGSCQFGGAKALAQLRIPPAENSVTATMPLVRERDGESCAVRARVRLERDGDTDYLAYTNHIRLILD